MERRGRRRLLRVIVIALVVALGTGYYLAARPPPGPRSLRVFEPDRVADLEVAMWQAYYAREKVRLFRLLVTLLHEQYRYPWTLATRAGFHLARAAATFGDARGDYERVLPDLERAYEIAKQWTGASYDSNAVARAELAWWVARRVAGQNSPENVGRLISEMYALYYAVPQPRVEQAGLLRAQAGALRDRGGRNADWPEVRRLLRQSFHSLHEAVN